MADGPHDDRSLDEGGPMSEDRAEDPGSSLDALAERLRDRADGTLDESESLASLVAELTETTAGSTPPSGDSSDPTIEGIDSPSTDESVSTPDHAVDSTAEDTGSSNDTDASSWSVDAVSFPRGASQSTARSPPVDPADLLAALTDDDGPAGSRSGTAGDASSDPSGNILVLGRLTGPACARHCVDLSTAADGDRVNALFVSVSQSVDERLEMWQEYAGEYPVNASHVDVGGRSRDGGSSVIETRAGPDTITVDSVSDPADLTRLGVTITRRLEAWAGNPYPTVVCVHSVTELLQYVELRRLFRFVQVLQNTLERVDGRAHYHLDPDAHDDRTLRLFETLVDETLRFEKSS